MTGKCFSGVNRGQRKKSDFYQTPYSMTEQLLDREDFKGKLLEPSCGDGAIVSILEKHGFEVDSFDIKNGLDFLNYKGKVNSVITNPPFSLAKEFILKAKEVATDKIALLLPLSYLHGKERHDLIYSDRVFPLARVYVFTRYPMLSDERLREDGKYKTGMMVYAWFVWDRNHISSPNIEWIDNQSYIISSRDK